MTNIQPNTAAHASCAPFPATAVPVAADISPIARLYTNIGAQEPAYWNQNPLQSSSHQPLLPDHATRDAIREQWRIIIDTLIQAVNGYHAALPAETFRNLHQNLSAFADQMQRDSAIAHEAYSEEIKSRLEIIAAAMLGDDTGKTPGRPEILQRLSDAMVLFPAVSASRKVLSTLTYLHVPPQKKLDARRGADVDSEDLGRGKIQRPDAGSETGDHQSGAKAAQPGVRVLPERPPDPGSPYLKLSPLPVRDCLAQHLELENSPQRVAMNMCRIHELAQDSAEREQYDQKDDIYTKNPSQFIYPSNWSGVCGAQVCLVHQHDQSALVRLLGHPYQPGSDSLLAAVARGKSVEVHNPKAVQLILKAYPATPQKKSDLEIALMGAMKSGQVATVDLLLDSRYEIYKASDAAYLRVVSLSVVSLSGIYSHALTCPNAAELVNKLIAHEKKLKGLSSAYDTTWLINQPDRSSGLTAMSRWALNEQVEGRILHVLLENGARVGHSAHQLRSALETAMESGSFLSVERVLRKCYLLYKATGVQELSGIYHRALTCPNAAELINMLAAHERMLKIPTQSYDPTILINERGKGGLTPVQLMVLKVEPYDIEKVSLALLRNGAHIDSDCLTGLQFTLGPRSMSALGDDRSSDGLDALIKTLRDLRLMVETSPPRPGQSH